MPDPMTREAAIEAFRYRRYGESAPEVTAFKRGWDAAYNSVTAQEGEGELRERLRRAGEVWDAWWLNSNWALLDEVARRIEADG